MADPARTRGRPRLSAVGVPSTRDRLMAAAAAVCVERGYEGATVGEIARRAGVTTGAIYNHFGGRSELLVESARQTLDAVGGARHLDVDAVVHRFLAPGFADTRRFLLELHGASMRHPDLAHLLGSWHAERAAELEAAGADRADIKALFLVLLGCCQLEALATIAVSQRRVEASVSAAAAGLGLDATT